MSSLQTAVETVVLRVAMGLPERAQRALLRKPVVLDGQTLAAETQMLLKLQEITKQPPLGVGMSAAEARPVVVQQGRMVAGKQPIGALRELTVDGAEGPIAARLYLPSSRLGADPVPTLMFIHGGGMALGDLDSHDGACRHLAELAGVQVLSIDYRLAPEHPFPAAVEDCFAAYQWLVKNADALNADPERLAVGGDSAGGLLSATTAIQAAEAGLPMAFQLLIYPVVDFTTRSRSQELFDGGGFYLTKEGMDRLSDWYFPDEAAKASPLGSPGARTELPSGLAPAFVATAGFDPLRDEGEAYARLLAQHGVPVTTQRYPSMIHGFFNMVGVGREARANAADIAARLKVALGA
ncbi:alpha/beta hydrolase [Nocardioides marmoriginsengisoli]|uniref:Alpha/beta hydrolase n=1 Tax=Nocardioides marmoriginsengisoli TaxID=661483 RepID=A0A3N0CRT4_9ACTN|nr:alpha/beta hydrolase [Nocardioides marmoriginsengisoli]RNL66069.1 alpha/beta hydrolase [Nocardioides marmoriginsengisoli]